MKIPLTDNRVREAIVAAREQCLHDSSLPLYGALTFASQSLTSDREAASSLYSAAKIHVDQTERVRLLDAAIAALPAPAEMGEGR